MNPTNQHQPTTLTTEPLFRYLTEQGSRETAVLLDDAMASLVDSLYYHPAPELPAIVIQYQTLRTLRDLLWHTVPD